ncbi:MAG: caspase domain-containing protein, partial [Bradyrhizobium sp.]
PVDAKISTPADLDGNSLRLVDVMGTLESIPSRMRIVVLDACRNNPFPGINDAGRGLAIVDAPNGSIVGYSTAPGTEALDGSNGHSPYTSAFLKLAREPNVPIEQLFKRVRLEVNNSTNGQQTPWESSSLTSDFYFFGDTAVAAMRAPSKAPVVQMASNLPSRSVRQAYDYVLSEGSPEHYQEFITLFPHDPLCYRIRALLRNLLQAQAWHRAVLANSPDAYKAFYDKNASSPYAQSALKLQAHPKIVPLMQFTHLMKPQQPGSTFKPNLSPSKDNLGIKLGDTGTQGYGGNLGGAFGDRKIVTLPAPGTNATTTPTGAGTGKIVTLPVTTVGKTGSNPDQKLNGRTNRVVDLPPTPHQQLATEGRNSGVIKLKANPQVNRPQSNLLPGKMSATKCQLKRVLRSVERPGPGASQIHALIPQDLRDHIISGQSI